MVACMLTQLGGTDGPPAVVIFLLERAALACMQVLHQTDHNKPAWDGLAWAVRTGGRPFERSHDGLDQFSWLKAHPAEEDKFSRAMSEIDAMGALSSLLPSSLPACDLADFLCLACIVWLGVLGCLSRVQMTLHIAWR